MCGSARVVMRVIEIPSVGGKEGMDKALNGEATKVKAGAACLIGFEAIAKVWACGGERLEAEACLKGSKVCIISFMI